MYRFRSSKNSTALKTDYLRQYNVNLLQRKLELFMLSYPDLKAILPGDLSAKRLLVADFKYLGKVYCCFVSYLKDKTPEERHLVRTALVNGGFNYDNHKGKIARFLMDPSNGFEIHNCVYCDLESVSVFPKADGSKVRRFEADHVLDKGECPLVALSLFNLVPSCWTCNSPSIKGTKTIGDVEAEMVKLSPSAEGYDYASKFRFEVIVTNPTAADLNAANHAGDYEIEFNVKDPLFWKSITLFELKSRYNNSKEKTELLKWRDKRRTNPDNIVQEFADIKKVSFEEMFEEMFELELRRKNHYPMEKSRRDVMLMF